MNNLIKLQENDNNTVYILDEKLQGLVSVPKDLKNNIRVFMLFKDNVEKELDKDKVINEILEVSKKINLGEDNGICIVAFMGKTLSDNNAIAYANELNNVKDFVNKIYNSLLSEGKLTKENFIKKLELLCNHDKYKNFIDFLCLQDPEKFYSNSYDKLMTKKNQDNLDVQTTVTSNLNNQLTEPVVNNVTSHNILNQQNVDLINNATMAAPINVTPITETLSIGNIPNNYQNTESTSGGGPSNNISNNNVLVRTKPNAFIKLPAVIFILVMSLVIGISVSLYFLK